MSDAYFPDTLIQSLIRLLPKNQRTPSAVANLHLFHSDRSNTRYQGAVSRCGLSIVLQGETRLQVGSQSYVRTPGEVIAVSAGLPVDALISRADARQPFLSAELSFDPHTVRSVMVQLEPVKGRYHPQGVKPFAIDEPLRQAFIRLLELVCLPDAHPYLAELLQQEIIYRLLTGADGREFQQALAMEAYSQQAAKAARWLQTHYQQPFDSAQLAAMCGMSTSNFFRRFKAATGLSPLQYQKQIRLQEARKRLCTGSTNVAAAAHQVGYASVSQFCREYARHFGENPAQVRPNGGGEEQE